MQRVMFKQTNTDNFSELGKIAKGLVAELVIENDIKLNSHVPLKVHFGEDGNVTYLPANTYDGLIDFVRSKGSETSFIETNVLYRGKRVNRTSHIALAKEHGFTRIPIIIADGETGESYYEETINKDYFKKCKIGLEYNNYKQYIICSHFKGHVLAGFGGAVKQLGMGFAARGGKLDQHSQMLPSVATIKCIGCGLCAKKCQTDAIFFTQNHTASIDKDKCVGCAGCIAHCPEGAIIFDWNSKNFMEKLAEYAFAAAQGKQMIYVNFLANITKDCDCMGTKQQALTDNVGVVVGLDPVALDTASLDLVQKYSKTKLFDNGRMCLAHAEKIGLGVREYSLVER